MFLKHTHSHHLFWSLRVHKMEKRQKVDEGQNQDKKVE